MGVVVSCDLLGNDALRRLSFPNRFNKPGRAAFLVITDLRGKLA